MDEHCVDQLIVTTLSLSEEMQYVHPWMLKCFSYKLASHKTMSVFVGVMYRDYVDDGVLQLPPTQSALFYISS